MDSFTERNRHKGKHKRQKELQINMIREETLQDTLESGYQNHKVSK